MIWYVEDDASIRDIGMYALNSAGFETRGFEDGISFWEALKKEKPELIVLDVMLPGMDGVEILTKMKESIEYSTIPVIMATARGQEYDRIRGGHPLCGNRRAVSEPDHYCGRSVSVFWRCAGVSAER